MLGAVVGARVLDSALSADGRKAWLTLDVDHRSCMRGPPNDQPTFFLRRVGASWRVESFGIGMC
jgi:hypothetical protein